MIERSVIDSEPRQHLARARDFEERRVHANDARVDVGTNVRDHAFTKPRYQIEAQGREHPERHGGREKRDEVEIDRRAILYDHALVDDVAKRERQHEQRRRRDQQRAECKHEDAAVTADVWPQGAQRPERAPLGAIDDFVHL
jgi:hypothetical protein